MDKMREEFEAWVVSEFDYDVSKYSNGTYHELKTFIAWESWKASRAALCVDTNKFDFEHNKNRCVYVDDLKIVMKNAGVKCK